MAGEEKIRLFIRELANRKRSVKLSEVEWVMSQIGRHVNVTQKENVHWRLYSLEGQRFSLCTHIPAGGHIKICYVSEFLNAMAASGWFEE